MHQNVAFPGKNIKISGHSTPCPTPDPTKRLWRLSDDAFGISTCSSLYEFLDTRPCLALVSVNKSSGLLSPKFVERERAICVYGPCVLEFLKSTDCTQCTATFKSHLA